MESKCHCTTRIFLFFFFFCNWFKVSFCLTSMINHNKKLPFFSAFYQFEPLTTFPGKNENETCMIKWKIKAALRSILVIIFVALFTTNEITNEIYFKMLHDRGKSLPILSICMQFDWTLNITISGKEAQKVLNDTIILRLDGPTWKKKNLLV